MPTESYQSTASDKKTQLDKFKQAARELECDEDEDRLKAKLRKVATAPKQKQEKLG